jgi:hypothetical protein
MDYEYTSTSNTQKTELIEVLFNFQSHRFPFPSNFASLVASVNDIFRDFNGLIYALDTNGEFVIVATDEDLQNAKRTSPNLLRVFLVNAHNAVKHLSRKYLSNWMKKNAKGTIPIAQPVVISLIVDGFRPNCIKKNFNIVIENAGDIEKTLAAFHTMTMGKKKRKSCGTAENTDHKPRKRRRCGLKTEEDRNELPELIEERKAEKARRESEKQERKAKNARRKSEKKERRKVHGQTHALSNEFTELAEQAYPGNVGERLLTKEFSKIVLDGNNMLFVTKALRDLTLRGQLHKAQQLLSVAALAFSQLVGISTEVVFDNAALHRRSSSSSSQVLEQHQSALNTANIAVFNTEISRIAEKGFPIIGVPLSFPNGTSVLVSSARPDFNTTDDKLIAWARLNDSSPSSVNVTSSITDTTMTDAEPNTTTISTNAVVHHNDPNNRSNNISNSSVVVVSSDRALAGELHSLGVVLIKPTKWMALFMSLVEGRDCSSEQSSFDQWCLTVVPV